MSVRDRLDDARVLYASNRRTGALLSALIAVAATSRKRYPRDTMGDGEAFKRFLHDEMATLTPARNFRVKFRGALIPLEDLLYHVVRCELAHEAELPEDVVFQPGANLSVRVDPDRITFSDALINRLANVVQQAAENADVFGGNADAVREDGQPG